MEGVDPLFLGHPLHWTCKTGMILMWFMNSQYACVPIQFGRRSIIFMAATIWDSSNADTWQSWEYVAHSSIYSITTAELYFLLLHFYPFFFLFFEFLRPFHLDYETLSIRHSEWDWFFFGWELENSLTSSNFNFITPKHVTNVWCRAR